MSRGCIKCCGILFLLSYCFCYQSPSVFTLPVIDTFLATSPPPSPTLPQLGRLVSNTALFLAAEMINNRTCDFPPFPQNMSLELLPMADFNIAPVAIRKMMNLAEQNHSLVVGFPAPATSIPASTVGKVFDIAIVSTFSPDSPLSCKLKYPYFTRIATETARHAKTMHAFLLYNYENYGLGWNDVAVISTITPYTIDFASQFIMLAPEEINILQYRQFLEDEEDISIDLQETKNSAARVILGLVTDNYAEFIEKANEEGLVSDQYVWFVTPATVALNFRTPLPLARGTIASLNYFPPDAKLKQCFVEAWRNADTEKYPFAGRGKDPPLGTYISFDSIVLIATAINTLNEMKMLDGQRIPAELWMQVIQNSTVDGLSGYIFFDENGDRVSTTTFQYYSPDENKFIDAGTWNEENGIVHTSDIIWYSNTTTVPDLDIRPGFSYWSCEDGKKGHDETGKTIVLQDPGSSDVDEIASYYHCDEFIDCQNLSDESKDCKSNYLVTFILFGIITGALMLVVLFLIIFVIIFGIKFKYLRLKTSSPIFLLVMLVSILIGYSSNFAFYGKPHPVACAFQPWLLGLPCISMIAALVVKNFRIWRIFRLPLKRKVISDLEISVLWSVIMIPPVVIVTLWTIISTPTAKLEVRNGEEHYVCTTGGFTGEPGGIVFFSVLVAYGVIVLFFGMMISILTRNAPSMFNESKLLSISIYNLAFLSVVIIPVFLILQPYHPFIAWILRTCAVLYAFTATLILQFAHKVIGILILDRGKNHKIQRPIISTTSFSGQSTQVTGSRG